MRHNDNNKTQILKKTRPVPVVIFQKYTGLYNMYILMTVGRSGLFCNELIFRSGVIC